MLSLSFCLHSPFANVKGREKQHKSPASTAHASAKNNAIAISTTPASTKDNTY